MRTILFASIFILSRLISNGQNIKALDDKNGFREAKFGMSPSSFKKLESVKNVPLKGIDEAGYKSVPSNHVSHVSYEIEFYDKDVDLHIGNYSLDKVGYWFYKNKLVTIEIYLGESRKDLYGILEILETADGKAVLKIDNFGEYHYVWQGEKVEMEYTPSYNYWRNTIRITCKALKSWEKEEQQHDEQLDQQEQEQDRKQEIQEAAKKL